MVKDNSEGCPYNTIMQLLLDTLLDTFINIQIMVGLKYEKQNMKSC